MGLPHNLKNYNLYHLLEVESFSDIRKIKQGYRRLAMKYHPDRFPMDKNSARKFELGVAAYKTLVDEEKRNLYDGMLKKKLLKALKFRKEEFVLQRLKTHKPFYSRHSVVDQDYNRFIDECRANFFKFLKSGAKVKVPPKVHSGKDMTGEEFENFVQEGRVNFQHFLKSLPRVCKRS
ncbi:MAG: DnaJ domain-containing protein [Nitrospinales bacterium]